MPAVQHTRVALESSVIAHGLPRPSNLEAALRMREAVIRFGAEPAVVAVIDGEVRVGITPAEERLLAEGADVVKVSVKDLPWLLASAGTGATTVASTLWCAHRAGIDVTATGGIGGVHRDRPYDVSADLDVLSRTRACLVCSGAKSILDLSATREKLDSLGVTVVGYGTDDFPAFYARDSGLAVDVRCDSPAEVASILASRDALALPGSVLVCVPVPARAALEHDELEYLIKRAVAAADIESIRAASLTPFLLSRLALDSGGRSIAANLALLENNAAVAAQIAVARAGMPR